MVILYTENNESLPPRQFHSYLQQLPLAHQQQVILYKYQEHAQSCLFGKLLLRRALDAMDLSNLALDQIKYSAYNRPYFDRESLDFNISHSGKFIICAASKLGRLGIDIELMKPIAFEEFVSHFSKAEMSQMLDGANGLQVFYSLWTKKEALIKANGKGLSIPLSEVNIENNMAEVEGESWFLHEVKIHPEYSCHLATNIVLKETVTIAFCAL